MKKLLVSLGLILSVGYRAAIPAPAVNAAAFVQKAHPPHQIGWRQLFNGKDLTGWKHVGKGSMSVENGLIRGLGGMGLLYRTGEKFGNCTLRVVYRMQKTNSNAGCSSASQRRCGVFQRSGGESTAVNRFGRDEFSVALKKPVADGSRTRTTRYP